MHFILENAHFLAYGAIIFTAAYGIIQVFLLVRQLNRRKFKNDKIAQSVVNEVRERVQRGEYEEAEEVCKSPRYWYTAFCWLTSAVIEKRDSPIGKIKQDVHTKFAHEILTVLESHLANINMVVKAEPMLGLMGTVLGMIGAFGRIAQETNPSPQSLMQELSLALYCTAGGLISSIPLMMIGNWLQIKIRRLEEQTLSQVGEVIEDIRNERGT